jgi:hypothetical protein
LVSLGFSPFSAFEKPLNPTQPREKKALKQRTCPRPPDKSADSGREMSGCPAHKLPVSLKAAQRFPDEMVEEGEKQEGTKRTK